MQIKLYGNGHSCNIPVQEIIDKYWKDETAPFSFEMSTAIGDETESDILWFTKWAKESRST